MFIPQYFSCSTVSKNQMWHVTCTLFTPEWTEFPSIWKCTWHRRAASCQQKVTTTYSNDSMCRLHTRGIFTHYIQQHLPDVSASHLNAVPVAGPFAPFWFYSCSRLAIKCLHLHNFLFATSEVWTLTHLTAPVGSVRPYQFSCYF